MYRIGDFSKMSRTTIKTLRYYDQVGLLRPASVDEENGYRYYTTEQLIPLHDIVALRQIGLSVEEVSLVMSGNDAKELLINRKAEIESELTAVREQLSRVNHILSRNKEDFLMDYQAVIKQLPACTVYYKQGIIPSFESLEAFILQSAEECQMANPGIQCIEPDYCYICYTDPEFKNTNIAVEYAQAVTSAGKETDTIHFKQLESVTAACVYHKGPYDTLNQAFAYAFNWVEQNGYIPSQRPRERYIDGKWNKENPEEWLTEIQIPVVKK